jgi:hypothetical protein
MYGWLLKDKIYDENNSNGGKFSEYCDQFVTIFIGN